MAAVTSREYVFLSGQASINHRLILTSLVESSSIRLVQLTFCTSVNILPAVLQHLMPMMNHFSSQSKNKK